MTDIMPVPVKAPFFRRLWLVVLMTCLLIPMPLAMIILLTGPVYRRKSDGYHPISNRTRHIYGGALVLWLVLVTLKGLLQPGGVQGEWERSANRVAPNSTVPAAERNATDTPRASAPREAQSDNLPACDSPEVIQTAREAIEEGPAGLAMGLRVRDVGKGHETLYEPDRKLRRCVAEALLNNGASLLTYQVLYGPSGNLMVQSQVGDTAAMQFEVDKAKRDEATRATQTQESQKPGTGAVP